MFEFVLSVIGFVVLILVLVTAHELGHYVVARMANVGVLKFSIGFGRPLVSWKDKRETEFQIGWLPFGGYVQMVDENDFEVPDDLKPYAFNRKSPLWRIAIAVAGPAANLLLAFLVFCLLHMAGVPSRIAYVGEVLPESIAEQAGVVPGSIIQRVNDAEVEDQFRAVNELLRYINEDTIIRLETDKGIHNLAVQEWVSKDGAPLIDETFGIRFGIPPVIRGTVRNKPAEEAGFEPNDRIVSVRDSPVYSYFEVALAIRESPGQPIPIVVDRQGLRKSLTLVPELQLSESGVEFGWAGIEFDSGEKIVSYSPIAVIPKALNETWRYSVQTVELMGKLVRGQMSKDSLAGPIGIAQIAGRSLAVRLEAFLMVLALISIFLALINLVPLPILDGGHVMYALIEMATRKPISVRVRTIGNQVSLVLVFALMLFVIYNDIARIFAN